MTWSFIIDGLLVSWNYGQQHGSFSVPDTMDFHTLNKDEQVKIASDITGVKSTPSVATAEPRGKSTD